MPELPNPGALRARLLCGASDQFLKRRHKRGQSDTEHPTDIANFDDVDASLASLDGTYVGLGLSQRFGKLNLLHPGADTKLSDEASNCKVFRAVDRFWHDRLSPKRSLSYIGNSYI
jgi:hypothetical protein